MIRLALAVALVAVLAACGTSGGGPAATSASVAERNINDEAFLRLEIAHHTQAIQMTDLALTNSRNAGVKSIARRVKSVQSTQVAEMSQRVRTWHAEIDEHKHVHEPPGTLSADEMSLLRATRGAAFDRYWAQLMVFHEMAAGELAQVELQRGIHPATRDLARRLDAAQSRLVDELLTLLKSFKPS